MVLGAAFALDATVALLVPSAYPAVFPVIQVAPVVLPVAVAVAVLRHRLFDVRVVVGRVLVYAVLTAVLLGVYVVTVVGVARVVPAGQDAGRLLAAAVVALAFAPLRARLQDVVARRLFGDRAQPYAALVARRQGGGRCADHSRRHAHLARGLDGGGTAFPLGGGGAENRRRRDGDRRGGATRRTPAASPRSPSGN